MSRCAECSTEFTSALAASECAEADQLDALRQRQWTRAHDKRGRSLPQKEEPSVQEAVGE